MCYYNNHENLRHNSRGRLEDLCKFGIKEVPSHYLILSVGLAIPVHPLYKLSVQFLQIRRGGKGREGRGGGERGQYKESDKSLEYPVADKLATVAGKQSSFYTGLWNHVLCSHLTQGQLKIQSIHA